MRFISLLSISRKCSYIHACYNFNKILFKYLTKNKSKLYKLCILFTFDIITQLFYLHKSIHSLTSHICGWVWQYSMSTHYSFTNCCTFICKDCISQDATKKPELETPISDGQHSSYTSHSQLKCEAWQCLNSVVTSPKSIPKNSSNNVDTDGKYNVMYKVVPRWGYATTQMYHPT